MAEKTVIDAMKMCSVEGQHGPFQSTVSWAIRSVDGDVLDEGVFAGRMHKAAMRAVVLPLVIKTVSNALMKNDALKAQIATFVSNRVEKKSNCVKKEEELFWSNI